MFLATKLSGDQSKGHIAEAFENSLRMLKTDHVDLYQLHRPKPQWPIEETMGELAKLQEQGKIGHIGLSNFSAAQTAEAIQYATVISHQPRYSMLFRESARWCTHHWPRDCSQASTDRTTCSPWKATRGGTSILQRREHAGGSRCHRTTQGLGVRSRPQPRATGGGVDTGQPGGNGNDLWRKVA